MSVNPKTLVEKFIRDSKGRSRLVAVTSVLAVFTVLITVGVLTFPAISISGSEDALREQGIDITAGQTTEDAEVVAPPADEAPIVAYDEASQAPGAESSENVAEAITEETQIGDVPVSGEGEEAEGESEADAPAEGEATEEEATEEKTEASNAAKEALAAADLSSQRLIVGSPSADALAEETNVVASFDNIYLIQYASAEEAEAGFLKFFDASEYVTPDVAVEIAEGEDNSDPEEEIINTDSVYTENENPFAELETALAEETTAEADAAAESNEIALIALIDTGAEAGNNVVEAVSMLGENPADDNGHGQRMVDYIVAENEAAQILSIKALGKDGKGDVSAVVAAINYAKERGASIINLSASAYASEENAALAEAVKAAEEAGIVVVGAAGNNGFNAKFYIPGNIEEATIVGAADAEGNRIAKSNFGETVDYNVVAESTSEAAARMSGFVSANGEAAIEEVLDQGFIFTTGYVAPVEEETEEATPETEEDTDEQLTAADNAKWTALQKAINEAEDGVEKEITIDSDLIAESTISIPAGKKIKLVADSAKTIYRKQNDANFSVFVVENGGELTIGNNITMTGTQAKFEAPSSGGSSSGAAINPTNLKNGDEIIIDLNGNYVFVEKSGANYQVYFKSLTSQPTGDAYKWVIDSYDSTSKTFLLKNKLLINDTSNKSDYAYLFNSFMYVNPANGTSTERFHLEKSGNNIYIKSSADKYPKADNQSVKFSEATAQPGTHRILDGSIAAVPSAVSTPEYSGALAESKKGFFVHVDNGGTFNLEGSAKLTNFKTSAEGVAPVYVAGTMNMKGGTISGNTAPKAGAVIVSGSNAKLNQSGGEIKENKSTNNDNSAGAIYADTSAEINLSGGSIKGNAAPIKNKNNTADLDVGWDATKTTNDNLLKQDTLHATAGAILIDGATLNMSNANATSIPSVSGNKGHAGAIYIKGGGTLNMRGGTVGESDAPNQGRNAIIAVDNGDFNMYSGEIQFNETTQYGTVTVFESGNMLMNTESGLSAPKIHDNKTVNKGGAVYVDSDDVKLIRGEMANNIAGYMGGAIYVVGDSPTNTRVLELGIDPEAKTYIYHNSAKETIGHRWGDGRGGGVWFCAWSTVLYDQNRVVIDENFLGDGTVSNPDMHADYSGYKDGGGVDVFKTAGAGLIAEWTEMNLPEGATEEKEVTTFTNWHKNDSDTGDQFWVKRTQDGYYGSAKLKNSNSLNTNGLSPSTGLLIHDNKAPLGGGLGLNGIITFRKLPVFREVGWANLDISKIWKDTESKTLIDPDDKKIELEVTLKDKNGKTVSNQSLKLQKGYSVDGTAGVGNDGSQAGVTVNNGGWHAIVPLSGYVNEVDYDTITSGNTTSYIPKWTNGIYAGVAGGGNFTVTTNGDSKVGTYNLWSGNATTGYTLEIKETVYQKISGITDTWQVVGTNNYDLNSVAVTKSESKETTREDVGGNVTIKYTHFTLTTSLTNEIKGSPLKLKKTDENGKGLANAKFNLFRVKSDGNKEWATAINATTKEVTWGPLAPATPLLSTPASGLLDIANLYPGSYGLVEQTPPPGHSIVAGTIYFDIDSATKAASIKSGAANVSYVTENGEDYLTINGKQVYATSGGKVTFESEGNTALKIKGNGGMWPHERGGLFDDGTKYLIFTTTSNYLRGSTGTDLSFVGNTNSRPATTWLYKVNVATGVNALKSNADQYLYIPGATATLTNNTSLLVSGVVPTVESTTGSSGTIVVENNRNKYPITIKKVDKNNQTVALSAEFEVVNRDTGAVVATQWTDATTGQATFNNLDWGTAYKLVEKTPPAGYRQLVTTEGIFFKIAFDGTVSPDNNGGRYENAPFNQNNINITVYNEQYKTNLRIKKIDSVSEAGLEKAKFTYRPINNPNDIKQEVETDANGYATFTNITDGYYSLWEKSEPYGYTKFSPDIPFKVENGVVTPITSASQLEGIPNNITTDWNALSNVAFTSADNTFTFTVPNTPLVPKLTLHKTDMGTNKLKGARFYIRELNSTTGAALAHLTEGADGVFTFDFAVEKESYKPSTYSPDKKYVIWEEAAPSGYVTSGSDIVFTIDRTGKIELILEDSQVGEAAVIKDNASSYISVNANKDVLTVKNEPKGEIRIEKVNTSNRPVSGAVLQVLNTQKKPVAIDDNGTTEWTTDGTAKVIKLSAGTYYLHEKSAPSPYEAAADMEFTVSSSNVGDQCIKLVMVDPKPGEVLITKTDHQGQGLEGAVLQILNPSGTVVEEWTSNGGTHTVTANLTPGVEYTLREVRAPEGYIAAEDQTFTIQSVAGGANTAFPTSDSCRIYITNQTIPKITITSGETSHLGYCLAKDVKNINSYTTTATPIESLPSTVPNARMIGLNKDKIAKVLWLGYENNKAGLFAYYQQRIREDSNGGAFAGERFNADDFRIATQAAIWYYTNGTDPLTNENLSNVQTAAALAILRIIEGSSITYKEAPDDNRPNSIDSRLAAIFNATYTYPSNMNLNVYYSGNAQPVVDASFPDASDGANVDLTVVNTPKTVDIYIDKDWVDVNNNEITNPKYKGSEITEVVVNLTRTIEDVENSALITELRVTKDKGKVNVVTIGGIDYTAVDTVWGLEIKGLPYVVVQNGEAKTYTYRITEVEDEAGRYEATTATPIPTEEKDPATSSRYARYTFELDNVVNVPKYKFNLVKGSTFTKEFDSAFNGVGGTSAIQGLTNSISLAGARFILVDTTPQTGHTYSDEHVREGSIGKYYTANGWKATGEADILYIETNEKGIMPTFENLIPGRYKLTEIKAPEKYVQVENDPTKAPTWVIEIDGDGKIEFKAISGPAQQPMINNMLEIPMVGIKNAPETFELPATGGMGTYVFVIGGVLLMLVAGVLFFRRNKGSEA